MTNANQDVIPQIETNGPEPLALAASIAGKTLLALAGFALGAVFGFSEALYIGLLQINVAC